MYAARVLPVPHPAFTSVTGTLDSATAVWNLSRSSLRSPNDLDRDSITACSSPRFGVAANELVIHCQRCESSGIAFGSAEPATSAAIKLFLTAATNRRSSGDNSSQSLRASLAH